MSNDTQRSARSGRGLVRTVASGLLRIFADLLAISLWVLFLTLLFLETGWPRWAFYALLVVGVGGYVTVTAAWTGDGD
ncbi:hypothetical protein [Natrinema altunense]|uniref:DUF8119 domain-containing protein n=2 Tax=Natrinema altunense TaxID=222984 RepID=L9ZVL4_NATA2|nr:hypothetical protein [Natrinema altunense]ELY90111.1 hypothetical protein C485_03648 [Natrinema altunense JCM 12890]RZH68561.1 hypothetical protein ELS17_03585 [Natrinema altunense]